MRKRRTAVGTDAAAGPCTAPRPPWPSRMGGPDTGQVAVAATEVQPRLIRQQRTSHRPGNARPAPALPFPATASRSIIAAANTRSAAGAVAAMSVPAAAATAPRQTTSHHRHDVHRRRRSGSSRGARDGRGRCGHCHGENHNGRRSSVWKNCTWGAMFPTACFHSAEVRERPRPAMQPCELRYLQISTNVLSVPSSVYPKNTGVPSSDDAILCGSLHVPTPPVTTVRDRPPGAAPSPFSARATATQSAVIHTLAHAGDQRRRGKLAAD